MNFGSYNYSTTLVTATEFLGYVLPRIQQSVLGAAFTTKQCTIRNSI